MKRHLLLLAVTIAMAACAPSAPRNTGVYLLVDTSGTYNRQVHKAEQIILYALSRLQSSDSIAVACINTGSFTEKDIIAKTTFDDRPSTANKQKRASSLINRRPHPTPTSLGVCCRRSSF